MTRNPIRRAGLVLLSLSLLLPLSALSAEDEKDLRELLRNALYTEEVTRDPEAAAKQYEALLSQHDAQRAFAASALFRLAEVRRKQDRKDEAIALYQKLLARFPEAEAEAKLARENLAALGAKLADTKGPAKDEEQEEIERLRKVAASSPDLLRDALRDAIHSEKVKVVEFLISQGADPKADPALFAAVERGNLAICKILLKHGKPSPQVASDAVAQAVRYDRIAILNYLLEQGFGANSPLLGEVNTKASPLHIAVESGNIKAATVLLDHGADIDFMIQSKDSPYVGTPLHRVIRLPGGLAMFRFLLERGAKPDLPKPNTGITPLHVAAWAAEVDSAEMVKELLARGADPNRRSTLAQLPDRQFEPFAMVTPFELALSSENQAKIEAMLAKGANPNLQDSEGRTLLSSALRKKDSKRIELLLRWKADPNVADKDGMTPLTYACIAGDKEMVGRLLDAGADPNKPGGQLTPLAAATKNKLGWPIVELLLAKGAKPEAETFRKAVEQSKWDVALKMLEAGAPLPDPAKSFPWESPLVRALQSPGSLPAFQKMLEMGGKLDEEWAKAGFPDSFFGAAANLSYAPIPLSTRPYLFRTFTLPRLESTGDIRMVIHGDGGTNVSVLEKSEEMSSRPRPLAELLLASREGLPWRSSVRLTDKLTIWRKSGDQWKAAHEFALGGEDAFPALEKGDVIELVEGSDKKDENPTVQSLSPELTWSLRKRISFPMTVEIDGKAQEVTLRGDRLVFDPAVPGVVPLGGARRVMQFFWRPEIDLDGFTPTGPRSPLDSMSIVIRRDGWPDIRIPFSGTGKDFPLRAHDRILLESPEIRPEEVTRRREQRVAVAAAGLPFIRHFGLNYSGSSKPDPRTIPSLLQAVAEVTQVHNLKDAPRDAAAMPSWLVERQWALACIQRPDLSKIRIRRLQVDGSEKVLDIDLTKIIADSPEDAAVEEVRKADMTLEGGDIVEIPVLPADEAKSWSGLTPREDAFLSKALSCRIQITDPTGNIRLQEIRYKAPRIMATEAGPIPVPLPEGVSSLNGSASLSSTPTPKVTRDGQEEIQIAPWEVFLKEGDRIVLAGSPSRPPRQQVLPPSPSR